MHELSIACDLVEAGHAAAKAAGAERVLVIRIRLGVMAGVVPEALFLGYESASQGTLLEGARLEIEEVALHVYCAACQHTSQLASPQNFACLYCGNPVTDILRGQEIEIINMEIALDAHPTS